MRAVFLPSHFDGDGYYRLLFPARELGRRGWDVAVAPHVMEPLPGGRSVAHYGVFREEAGRLRVERQIAEWLVTEPFDVLVMQQRGEAGWAELVRGLHEVGKKVVVDSDDCWLGLPAWNPGSQKPRGEVDAMLELLTVADGVSVATPALAEVYGDWCDGRVIRNRLDWPMWEQVAPVCEGRRWRRLRVGWMGEVLWRRGDVEVLRETVVPWLQAHPEVEFVAAGDPRVHEILGVPENQRVSTASTPFANMDLADITATFDIGLVPLARGSVKSRRLNDCKSHLKGMEYAACGIPCVATATESYRWWLEDEETGFLVEKPADWTAALDALLDDGLRRQMGRAARAKAETSTVQEHGHEWSGFLTGVCVGLDAELAGPRAAAR